LPGSSEVRIAHRNASAALSAMMLTSRDAVTDPKYELVCTIHGVTITGVTFARDRQFKKHHLGNLLGSRGVASRILELFESDPSLGVVMPPTVHIAHSTTRDHQSPGTVEWANALGVSAPLDIFTAETPAGMFWFRPRALKRLLDFKFEPRHFEPQPNEYLELILRRLVWPAAHTEGHTVKCVLTPASMATNYVKLEYKLQALIAGPTAPRRPDFPRGEMEAFIRDRLADRPSTLTVVETSIRAARGLFRVAKTVTSTFAPREPQ
jgi:rhamnosyltransferase